MLHVPHFKFPKEYPVAAMCFHDYAGGEFTNAWLLENNLAYTEQGLVHLNVI